MSNAWLMTLVAALLLLRLSSLRRFWGLPLKQGEGWFFTTEVAPGFYQGAGADLLRRYRGWLLLPLFLDAVAVAMLFVNDKSFYLLIVTTVLMVVFYNLLVHNLAYRAKTFAAPATAAQATATQLLLEPRRLRDHTNWLLEAVIVVLMAAALAAYPSFHFTFFWLLYLQIGLLLLKQVFVRWRMKLPLTRTEDYRRWRAAWLTYHLRVFDATRVLVALAACFLTVPENFARMATVSFWALTMLLFVAYCVRESRRLAVVQREVQPVTLAREFPSSPVAEGRFFAGGLLYFNPDNPVVLARSPHGLALNLAHRGTYLWLAYLSGLLLLALWQIAR